MNERAEKRMVCGQSVSYTPLDVYKRQVQYMMDKRKLQEEYEGNVKKQRHGAKDRSDAISFISYRETVSYTHLILQDDAAFLILFQDEQRDR